MDNILKFLVGLQAQYDALQVKDDNTLYFIMDTHRIYRGETLFASGLIENLGQVNNPAFPSAICSAAVSCLRSV